MNYRTVLRKLAGLRPCRWVRNLGLHRPRVFRQRVVNWLFQRLLGLNRDSPWSVHFTSRVVMPKQIILGHGVERSLMFSGGCYLQGGNGIVIGDRTLFAPGVKIISANHGFSGSRQWVPGPPVTIGCDCWIGANAVILPGVSLGDRVIVGAGSVVTHSFESGVVIGGNPAEVLRVLSEEGAYEGGVAMSRGTEDKSG